MKRVLAMLILLVFAGCATLPEPTPRLVTPPITKDDRCWSVKTRSTVLSSLATGALFVAGPAGLIAIKTEDPKAQLALALGGVVFAAIAAGLYEADKSTVELRREVCDTIPLAGSSTVTPTR